jgi:hypothetical protein
MKNATRHTGTLTVVKRLKSSVNGNPRYLVMLDGYIASTVIDSSLGYSITNFDGKYVNADIGTHYGTITIENVKLVK